MCITTIACRCPSGLRGVDDFCLIYVNSCRRASPRVELTFGQIVVLCCASTPSKNSLILVYIPEYTSRELFVYALYLLHALTSKYYRLISCHLGCCGILQ